MLRFASQIAAVVFVLAALGGANPVTSATDPAFGFWRTERGNAIVEIAACESGACGEMVWIDKPVDETGALKRDAEGRPLCGLQLVSGLKKAALGVWEEGEILDPRSGQRYGAEISVIDADKLNVRGYLLTSIFGASQVWTRASGDQGGC
ncbi:MAG: DUF2147 domain-containing protein [Pseudomonadota bacterium]